MKTYLAMLVMFADIIALTINPTIQSGLAGVGWLLLLAISIPAARQLWRAVIG